MGDRSHQSSGRFFTAAAWALFIALTSGCADETPAAKVPVAAYKEPSPTFVARGVVRSADDEIAVQLTAFSENGSGCSFEPGQVLDVEYDKKTVFHRIPLRGLPDNLAGKDVIIRGAITKSGCRPVGESVTVMTPAAPPPPPAAPA